MKNIKIKELLKSSFYITPIIKDVEETKRYKIEFSKILLYTGLYSLFLVLITFLVLLILPSEKLIYFFENKKIEEATFKIEKLEKQILLLNQQLNNITKENRRLKLAIYLGQNDTIDTTSAVYDSLRAVDNNYGGNLFYIIKKFLQGFDYPLVGTISKEFDVKSGHLGIDISAPIKSPIKSIAKGRVLLSEYSAKYGKTLIILHENNFISVYKHCAQILVNQYDLVEKNEIVAIVGNSGLSSKGPHLHFELWKDNRPVNPRDYLIEK